MTFQEVMRELESLGTEQTRKIYTNHGADIDQFGVSIANIKKVAKKLKGQHEVGYQLFNSKNVDAIYLSQYVVDPNKLTSTDFDNLIDTTEYYMILDNVVAALIARNDGLWKQLLDEYLVSDNHRKRQVAYSLYSYLLSSKPNDELDFEHIKKYINIVKSNLQEEANRVKYSMNNFIIAAGAASNEITDLSKDAAKVIGKVDVYMGKTSCKVPDAYTYIEKIEKMGNIGKKRKLT